MYFGGVIGRKEQKYTRKKSNQRLCIQRELFSREKSGFDKFVRHGQLEYLSQGSYGYVFKVTLPPGKKQFSPYVHLDKSPVTSLVFKLVVVHKSVKSVKLFRNLDSISSVTKKEFEEEVELQLDIYEKSLRQFNFAICPNIVETDLFSPETFKRKYPTLAPINTMDQSLQIGLIAMETYPDAKSGSKLQSSLTSKEFVELKMRVMYLLMKLAVLGYFHGDPSMNNVLLEGKRPYLIDFGQTKKLKSKVNKNGKF